MGRMLPARPHLEQLRRQAKELRTAHQARDPEAADRLRAHLPRLAGATDDATFAAPLTLADAQLALAREYGFPSWARLREHVQMLSQADALKEAISRDDLAGVKALIAADRSLLQAPIGYGGDGALTWAAECRGATPPTSERLAIARFLIAAGADVHEGGDGPLMRAALNDGRIPMMELLVQHGADVNARWHGHYPIIHGPCECLAPRALRWLLEHGADPDLPGFDPYPGTALDMVIGTYARGHTTQHECANLLIEAGATSRYDGLPTLPIHRGRLDLLALWLQENPDEVNRRFPELDYGGTAHRSLNLKGGTLLHTAAEYCEAEAARVLIEHGADVNARALVDERGVGGQTPIFHAATQYHDLGVPVARLLIEQGADLSIRARVPGVHPDAPGAEKHVPDEWLEVTPLGYAVRFPYGGLACWGAVELLLQQGAPAGDVYAAATLGLVEELRALLRAGGDPNARNVDGETALAAATANGHTQAAALLREAGALDEASGEDR
jgi:ankyrin repeat protein